MVLSFPRCPADFHNLCWSDQALWIVMPFFPTNAMVQLALEKVFSLFLMGEVKSDLQ